MSFLTSATSTLGQAAGGLSPWGVGLSVAGQIFGAIKGAKANRANEDALQKQYAENAAFYGNNAKRDYLQTNGAQSVMTQYKQQLQDAQKQVAGRAAITGGSDESVVAQNTGVQRNFANALSNIAAQGVNYQLGQERMYRANLDALNQRRMMLNQQKAQNAANLVANAGDLFNTLSFAGVMKNRQPSNGGVGETAQATPQFNAPMTAASIVPGGYTENNYQNP